jgi:effector-binding domain-containing protein
MEIKELSNVFVYYKQIRTNLKEIGRFVGITPAKVAEEAIAKGYKIIGPQIWNYVGADGNPETEFFVDICFPIDNIADPNDNGTKYLDGYTGACYLLKGPWCDLGDAYSKLFAQMTEKGLKPTDKCREVYHFCDFENPENCITEIQMGIQ